jgi:MAF protein
MIILASNSPRRKQLLALTGWDFQVLAATVDESVWPSEPPDAYVRRLAQGKAQATVERIPLTERSGVLVVAADTAVVDRGEILGKPAGAAEAEIMLRRLRGRIHQVYTGLAVLRPGDGAGMKPAILTDVTMTHVCMRGYNDAEIQTYIASGDPLDKAGAYAIQHADFHPVQNLQGCYANVMGLPVCHLARLLAKFGLQPPPSLAEDCQETLETPCQVFLQVSR